MRLPFAILLLTLLGQRLFAVVPECGDAYIEMVGETVVIAHPSGGDRLSRAELLTVNGQKKVFKGEPFMRPQAINNELAAGLVARKLGIQRVPQPERAVVNGKQGVLFDHFEGTDIERCDPSVQGAPETRRALEEAKIFDFLIANGDRSYGPEFNNALIAVSADGLVREVYLIDHHSAFLHGTEKELSSLPKTLNETLLEKMKSVSEAEWRQTLANLISPSEMDHFITRRNQLLRHFATQSP